MNNPYTSRGPIADPVMFFGRCAELQEIASFISHHQSVSIVGPEKIGKSSLLLHLMRPETLSGFQMFSDMVFVYLDCTILADDPPEQCLATFGELVSTTLQKNGHAPEPTLQAVISHPGWSAVDRSLFNLSKRGLNLVVALDEFEQLAGNPHLEVSFYNALRSLAGRFRLSFITCSNQPLIELTCLNQTTGILSSPFFNIFSMINLGLFSKAEAEALIRVPWEATGVEGSTRHEDVIYQLAGGHPYALQIACYHAFENPGCWNIIEESTVRDLSKLFQSYWDRLSAIEHEALKHPGNASQQSASDPSIRSVLRDLTRKCLLVCSDGDYFYPSKSWAEFVSKQA